ncbi:extracellular solute-binding protein [Paenibacillus planticolens]|uniref:Extracellular solute-binding protein n=1 Tax=Paenibacillus planticolens TaxID=2654976 RepID=A0ABX1ZJ76_9BACL|nr:extracellular solute-binding protein [Paenibacillus planticolens]NOU98694.1 extracellular solute-binding protein [Paenibacillus planticolens]
MNKSVVLVLATTLSFGSLAACSTKGSQTDNKDVTLKAIFMKQAGYSEETTQQATDEFMKANPTIKVEPIFVPYEALEQKIITGGGSYDVVLIDAPWTAKFAKAGIIMDVTDKLPDSDRKEIFQGALDAVSYNNKLYGMPWLNDTKYLFYNKEMLQQAGIAAPPKTWDELIADAKILKDKKIVDFPIAWSWKQAEALVCDVTSITESFGGHLVTDGKPTVNSPANVEAINFMVQSLKSGLSNPSSLEFLEEDVRGAFSSGKAAFALNWTYMYDMANNDSKESQVVGKVGIALSPGTSKMASATVNGGMGLAIPKGSKNADAAWKYIQFLAAKDFQKKYAKDALPIWKSLFDDQAVIATNPDLVNLSKTQYGYLVNRAVVPWYGEFSTELQVAISKALNGSVTVQAALDALQQKAIKISESK